MQTPWVHDLSDLYQLFRKHVGPGSNLPISLPSSSWYLEGNPPAIFGMSVTFSIQYLSYEITPLSTRFVYLLGANHPRKWQPNPSHHPRVPTGPPSHVMRVIHASPINSFKTSMSLFSCLCLVPFYRLTASAVLCLHHPLPHPLFFSAISQKLRLSYCPSSYCRAGACRLIFAGCCRRHCSLPSSLVANPWRYSSLTATARRNRLDPRMYPAAGAAFCNVVTTSWISFKPKAKRVVSSTRTRSWPSKSWRAKWCCSSSRSAWAARQSACCFAACSSASFARSRWRGWPSCCCNGFESRPRQHKDEAVRHQVRCSAVLLLSGCRCASHTPRQRKTSALAWQKARWGRSNKSAWA